MAMSNELQGRSPRKAPVKNSGSKKKKSGFANFIRFLIFIVSIGVLIYCGINLYTYFKGDASVDELLEKLQTEYSTHADSSDAHKVLKNGMLAKFEGLYKQNEDIIGWIQIDDTAVNYPVMQTTDNVFYLTHDFMKNESKSGALFIDSKGPITKDSRPEGIVIYGHNMKSGEFFHDALEYKDIDFFKNHMTITFDTLYEENKYKVFACFLTGGEPSQDNGNFFKYHCMQNFGSSMEFDDFYKEVMKRSYYNTDVDVEYGDELIMLSTCSNEYYDSRFVVMARKVRDGESTEVNKDAVTPNNDKYMPKEWYEIYG